MGSPKFILLLLMLLYAYILGAAVDAHIQSIDASNYPHVSGYLSSCRRAGQPGVL